MSRIRTSTDSNIRAAYQVARLIRNAFAHAPFAPTWSVDPDCRDQVFAISEVISLDTTGLSGTAFDWRHYGGPLALFELCRFVRIKVLGHEPMPRSVVPVPRQVIYQQGDLILRQVETFPENAEIVCVDRAGEEGLDLGGGHVVGQVRTD